MTTGETQPPTRPARATDMADPSQEWRRIATEFAGTLVLVLVASGTPAVAAYTGAGLSREAAALAPALTVMGLIYAFGDVSGMHINPVATLGFALYGAFPWRRVPAYVAAQFLGGVAAASMLRALVGTAGNFGTTTPGRGDVRALIAEIVVTMVLIVVILGISYGAKIVGHNGALAVSGWVAAAALVAGPLSGASMNPARTLGPDLLRGDLSTTWIYFAGPAVGAVLAVAVATVLHGRPSEAERRAAGGG
ncbi:MAG TPA: aquaporin [Dehalococcoidia bacterium]|nr:aquaporin [Dehalococcoidia bacterium]